MAIYQMKLQGIQNSVPIQTAFHIAKAGAVLDEGQLDAVAQAMIDTWDETLQALIADDFSWVQVQSRRVDQLDQPSITRTVTGLPLAGSAITTAMPRSVAVLLRWFSNTEEPNRGWNFVPGWTTASWAGTGWNTTALSAVQAWGDALLAEVPLASDGFEVVIARISSLDPQTSLANTAKRGVSPAIEAIVRGRRFA